jgi:tRNA-splicing ligase RtcB
MADLSRLVRVSDTVSELPVDFKEGMLVPARIYATSELLGAMDEGVFEQISNVAALPGIRRYAMCMPDGHWGYGFPIGGVAAMDADTGVISPGGIGFDVNCGMRLVATGLRYDEVKPHLQELVDQLFQRVPAGVGRSGFVAVSRGEFLDVAARGAAWAVERGYGRQQDLEMTEEHGCIPGADPERISSRSIERGYRQIGTLGSGNHYLEIQRVGPEDVFDPELAEAFGVSMPDQVVVMFHCGSRGFGHQVASDYLRAFLKTMQPKHGIPVRDRELACAPFQSREGQDYFAAMKCAINMSFANRQVILHRIREVFSDVFRRTPEDLGIRQVYDVAHNTAKLERHLLDGEERQLLVHRKGSTRAFGPERPELPERYRRTGQPVIIGGSMETGSYLLAGTRSGEETFFSTAHGSGRVMSRKKATKRFSGPDLARKMRERGIYVRGASSRGLAEEAGDAYKSVDEVIRAAHLAGISKPVCRFRPIGNIKG